MAWPKRNRAERQQSAEELREILVEAMAKVGADPAFIYAFKKTGVYLCEEN
jgi:hypothetical protein